MEAHGDHRRQTQRLSQTQEDLCMAEIFFKILKEKLRHGESVRWALEVNSMTESGRSWMVRGGRVGEAGGLK